MHTRLNWPRWGYQTVQWCWRPCLLPKTRYLSRERRFSNWGDKFRSFFIVLCCLSSVLHFERRLYLYLREFNTSTSLLTSPASDSIHTTQNKFEYPALFLPFGLPFTLIRHQNGAFQKRSSNRRNLKRGLFVFVWMDGAFNHDDVALIMWFPCPSFSQTQIQNDRWLLRSVNGAL